MQWDSRLRWEYVFAEYREINSGVDRCNRSDDERNHDYKDHTLELHSIYYYFIKLVNLRSVYLEKIKINKKYYFFK